MTRRTIRLAADLVLPVDAGTQTFLVVGKRGSGKSTTCVRLAEQLYAAGVPFVVLDPVDNWWGLKASKDGTGPGLGVYVFGGRRGDLPLEPTAGALMADVVLEHRISAVLSLKHFTGGERARFTSDFAQRLFQRNTEPLHVFLEEAHEVAPQNPYAGEQEMLGRIARIWKLGRSSGLGGTAITQRPASLSKNITTQAEVLIVHRTLGPQDVAAVREWIRYHGEQEDILRELATLKTGEAFVWAPDWPEGSPIGLKRVRMLDRETFDSSATPRAGERRVEPKALAPVDLERLRGQMAATIERAKADDPKALRARIGALEAELRKAQTGAPDPQALERAREEGARLLAAALRRDRTDVIGWAKEATRKLEEVHQEVEGIALELERRLERDNQAAPPVSPLTARIRAQQRAGAGRSVAEILTNPTAIMVSRPNAGEPPLGAERNVLRVLAARHPDRLTRAELGTLAGYSPNGGTFIKYLGLLRSAGYLDEDRDGITASAAGLAAIGPVPRIALPADLQALWLGKLGAERKLLEVLIAAHPRTITRQQLAERSGYEVSGGTFIKYLGILRTNRLLDETREGIRVVATLVEG